jgi:hypothetical protein
LGLVLAQAGYLGKLSANSAFMLTPYFGASWFFPTFGGGPVSLHSNWQKAHLEIYLRAFLKS